MSGSVSLRPAKALAPFVDWFGWYESDLPPARETSVPTGLCALMVNLAEDELRWYDDAGRVHRRSGIGVCAARPGPITIDTAEQRRTICVAFRPAGAYPFFDAPPGALDEPVVDLADLWGPRRATCANACSPRPPRTPRCSRSSPSSPPAPPARPTSTPASWRRPRRWAAAPAWPRSATGSARRPGVCAAGSPSGWG